MSNGGEQALFSERKIWVVDLSEGNEGRRDCSEIYYSGRTGTVLAAWLLHRDPALSAIDAMSRVREGYLPEYARARFPEHPSQADALEQFAHARHDP
jgi:hypothetical protein